MRGSAPGRLDLLGGVADYSGALVLEMPTRQAAVVNVDGNGDFEVGPASLSADELARLASLPYDKVREALAPLPRWTHYVIGVAVVLLRHRVISEVRGTVTVLSDLPASVGVASSAALEVATARALGAGAIPPLSLAALCQEAENQVVGAPCGIMDQVAVAVGVCDAVLPILCRPASVDVPVAVPDSLEIVGWPTGVAHDVGGDPYRRARAAAFMGKRMVEDATGHSWEWVSELPASAVESLPEVLRGSEYIDHWGDHGDTATTVDPSEWYPVRASTSFGGEEHLRGAMALAALRKGDAANGGIRYGREPRRLRDHGTRPSHRHHPGRGSAGEAGRPWGPVERWWLWRHRRGPLRPWRAR